MDEETILSWIAKVKEDGHFVNIALEEVTITPSIAAAMISLFRTTARYGRIFERLTIEFCDGYGVDLIVTAALMMDGIKSLFLAMDQPRDEIISRLATTLRINTSLLSLWLLVPLTEISAMALADALRENEILEKLSLSGCNFDKPDDEDDDDDTEGRHKSSDMASLDTADVTFFSPMETAAALSEGLRENATLQTVDFSCCYLEDDALSVLVQSLVGHPSLCTLDISRNSGRQQTMRALADVVGMDSTPLQCLDVREQSDKMPLEISPFSIAMQANQSIQTLRLSHNQLTDGHIIQLIDNLQGNKVIHELDLQYNQITEEGLNHLMERLDGMKSLEVLLLGGNAFGEEGQTMLAKLQDDDESVCTIGGTKALNNKKTRNKQSSGSVKQSSPRKQKMTSGFAGFSGFVGKGRDSKTSEEGSS
jgi:hypothetical protein